MPSVEYDSSRESLYSPSTRPTLFDAEFKYSDTQLSIESSRLAYLQAEDSAIELALLSDALSRVQFADLKPFNSAKTGSQGFGAYRAADKTALIAFRGTEPEELADLATVLEAHTAPWTESAGRVHAGFASAARAVLPQLNWWLEEKCPEHSRLILCGHSLGAALATLVASIRKPTLLLTIGSPRVGNSQFASTLDGVAVTRLVNCCDVVTQVPPETPWYVHVGSTTYIDRHGEVSTKSSTADELEDRNHARAEYFAHYAGRTGSVLLRDLADHSPINYARAFFP